MLYKPNLEIPMWKRKEYTVKCPQCGNDLDIVDGRLYCRTCGKSPSDEPDPESSAREKEQSVNENARIESSNGYARPKLEYCPWEDQEELGFAQGFYLTVKESMFGAERFFGRMPKSNGYLLPLLYALIIQTLGVMFSYIWAFVTGNPLLEQFNLTGDRSLIVGLAVPPLVFLGVALWAAILHLALFLVGGANEDFEVTFRVGCYSSGPELLNLVPVVGGFVAFVWKIYITIVGLREAHRISMIRASAAVVIPTLLCCGIFFGLSFMFNLSMTSN
jgi:hypothetical protein